MNMKVVVAFIHGQRKPFQEQMEKLGGGPLTTLIPLPAAREGWSSVHPLSPPLLSLGAGLAVWGVFAVPSFTTCGLGL